MCRLLNILLLLLTSASIWADNRAIIDKIESIIENQTPDGSDVALMVYDLTADSCLYGYREAVLSRPASVMKVMTSVAALSCLGPDYKFETKLCYTGTIDSDSTLHGNIYLVGDIDPLLMEGELKSMVSDIKRSGIRRIDGVVYADVSLMDSIHWGSGWSWDDTPASFQPYISPLMVHGGYVGVSVRPTTRGAAPQVNIYPANSFIKVENSAITNDPRQGPLTIRRDWLHNDNTILVSGNSQRNQATDLSIVGSHLFCFELFKEYMLQQGVEAKTYGWGVAPSSSLTISKVSRPLSEVMRVALKESDNLCAEAMFLHLAKLSVRKQLSFKDAIRYEENFLRRIMGVNKVNCNIADGSGLSMYDYVSPSTFVELLRYVYGKAELYNIIYRSLPVSGVDGTLRGRLGQKGTFSKIHAKTGTVTGACTLAGYAKSADGRDLAFCIMNQGVISMTPARRMQDAICEALCE